MLWETDDPFSTKLRIKLAISNNFGTFFAKLGHLFEQN